MLWKIYRKIKISIGMWCAKWNLNGLCLKFCLQFSLIASEFSCPCHVVKDKRNLSKWSFTNGAVHKLCRLKIVVFLFCKICNFLPPPPTETTQFMDSPKIGWQKMVLLEPVSTHSFMTTYFLNDPEKETGFQSFTLHH